VLSIILVYLSNGILFRTNDSGIVIRVFVYIVKFRLECGCRDGLDMAGTAGRICGTVTDGGGGSRLVGNHGGDKGSDWIFACKHCSLQLTITECGAGAECTSKRDLGDFFLVIFQRKFNCDYKYCYPYRIMVFFGVTHIVTLNTDLRREFGGEGGLKS
jgi:hypothetical protein